MIAHERSGNADEGGRDDDWRCPRNLPLEPSGPRHPVEDEAGGNTDREQDHKDDGWIEHDGSPSQYGRMVPSVIGRRKAASRVMPLAFGFAPRGPACGTSAADRPDEQVEIFAAVVVG